MAREGSAGLAQGKVALVTGAGHGIGEASARLFATEGAAVAVADLDGDAAERVAAAIEADGGRAIALTVDVTDEDQVAGMVASVTSLLGGLDAAHNNAGISGSPGTFTDLTLADWRHLIDTNLTSVFLCMKHELAFMSAQGRGAIVNTSSGAGVVAAPGLPHYTAAKHGVLGLTKCAAQEFARAGVRVNAVLREDGHSGDRARHAGRARRDRPSRRVAVQRSRELRERRVDARRRRHRLPLTDPVSDTVPWCLTPLRGV
jgi:NAD(P)-dependent dehydrogenase (short-subunit alcohol dehydrogenase family)